MVIVAQSCLQFLGHLEQTVSCLTLCWAQHGRLLLPAGQAWYGRELHASIPVRLPSYCSKHLWCEQPVKEIQLTSTCYVQICVYSSSYDDFLRWIVDWPRSPTPPVPIAISSSKSPLLSFAPVRWMDTTNFINVEVRVCYSFSKHNIFSTKAIESFIVVWYCRRDPSRKPATRFFDFDFQKLSHFRFEHKDNANGAGGSSGSLVLLLFTRFSRDCTEISLFGSSEVYRSQPDVLGRSAREPARTFLDVAPGKGLRNMVVVAQSCLQFLGHLEQTVSCLRNMVIVAQSCLQFLGHLEQWAV